MTTKKLLVFFIFVVSMPLANSRYASPWDKNLFADYQIVGSHHFHSIQNEKDSKNHSKVISKNKRDSEDDILQILLNDNDMETEKAAPPYKVCNTNGCKNLAIEFRKSFNETIDPCDNFYDFACSGWKATTPMPYHKSTWNRFAILSDITSRRLKAILESKPVSSDILPVKQAKRWYTACMNAETGDLKSIASIMTQIGGWPMAINDGDWDQNEYNWQKVENYYANLTGSFVFYDIEIENPSEDSAFGRINIVAPKIPLMEQFRGWLQYDNEDSYRQYLTLVSKVVRAFAGYSQTSVSDERLRIETEEMLLFAKAIFELSIPDPSKDYFKNTSYEDMTNWYDYNEPHEINIDWKSIIQSIFNIANIKVHPSTEVYVENGKYIEGIGELLQQTSSRTIVNYIHWYFIGQLPYMGIALDFTTKNMSDQTRSRNCVNKMNMEHALSYVFVKKYYTRRIGKSAKEMIKNVRAAMGENIDDSTWLDPESKALLKEKLNSMKTYVGFPKWYDNKTAVINYYKGVKIGNNSFDNSVSYMRFERQQYLRQYITPTSLPPNTLQLPITVTASYNLEYNYAQFPAVNFQSPFFGLDLPINVKYGIVGPVIGHEMGHAFDTCGITRGIDGNETTLTDVALKSYYQGANCFVDQFNKYLGSSKVADGVKRNCPNEVGGDEDSYGQITVTENIADTTGLQAAFRAYKKFSKMRNPNGERRLPELDHFTDDQLFFLSFAEVWCELSTPMLNRHDPHSRPDLRVNGAVSNSNDFAKAFNCPTGSLMNPIQKCNIWNKPGDN